MDIASGLLKTSQRSNLFKTAEVKYLQHFNAWRCEDFLWVKEEWINTQIGLQYPTCTYLSFGVATCSKTMIKRTWGFSSLSWVGRWAKYKQNPHTWYHFPSPFKSTQWRFYCKIYMCTYGTPDSASLAVMSPGVRLMEKTCGL